MGDKIIVYVGKLKHGSINQVFRKKNDKIVLVTHH
jgi:hypothetical protein